MQGLHLLWTMAWMPRNLHCFQNAFCVVRTNRAPAHVWLLPSIWQLVGRSHKNYFFARERSRSSHFVRL